MKTQTIHTNEMTPRPFFGRPANEATHNLTGVARLSAVATTHDHKEVNKKSHAIAEKAQVLSLQPQTNNRTQMSINSLIGKLATIAPKAALLVIVAVAALAASPMASGQCSYSWGGIPQ